MEKRQKKPYISLNKHKLFFNLCFKKEGMNNLKVSELRGLKPG